MSRAREAAKIMAEAAMATEKKSKTLYYLPKETRFSKGVGAALPEAYRKFWKEWMETPQTPIHWIPREGKYEKWKDGSVHQIQNRPIPVKYPKQLHKGIWGGETVIQGMIRKGKWLHRVPKFWVPVVEQNTLYSEILNEYMSCTTTRRTMMLIHQNYGFDYYLLKTKAYDLQSELALSIKRHILHALWYKTLYPADPEKRKEVYNKYKDFLNDYTEDDIEWYGLTYKQAIVKYYGLETDKIVHMPMKVSLRVQVVQSLKGGMLPEVKKTHTEVATQAQRSWIEKINPFSKD